MDPIADMFNQIWNAQAVKKPTVSLPCSNFKYEVAKILEQKGFVGKIEKKGRKTKKGLLINLKYDNGEPAIQGWKKISKPGQRIYRSLGQIKPVRGGYGLAIISTSKGLVTDKEARKQKLGGEVLCEVW